MVLRHPEEDCEAGSALAQRITDRYRCAAAMQLALRDTRFTLSATRLQAGNWPKGIDGVAMRTITWKLHLKSSPAEVYRMLATPGGRQRFWAESAEEAENQIEFHFSDGAVLRSRIITAEPDRELCVTYFDGSRVTFRLARDERDGTDLLLTEDGVSEENWQENMPGWVSVLLNLKAAVDHGVDLRNHDPRRTWEIGYVDV
jgi:uncharacterized protein YndB with AHSA1/START domain